MTEPASVWRCLLALLLLCGKSCAYPVGTLRCVSTLTRPEAESTGGLLNCPQTRNSVCVKEVVDLHKRDCGRSDSYESTAGFQNFRQNDGTYSEYPLWPFRWNPAPDYKACEYRKCAAECEEGVTTFQYQGKTYHRYTYCCNDVDYCNPATGTFRGSPAEHGLVLALACSLLATCLNSFRWWRVAW